MKRLATVICLITFLASLAFATGEKVYMVNVYPGSDIYTLEGHSAIWVQTPGESLAYNYGVFDFNSPNFVYRFVKGETDYLLLAYPFALFMNEYQKEGRRVVAHELNLDSLQTHRLIGLLHENALPQNRTYRYNYVKDNCATRPLRMVELAVGDTITFGPAPFEAQSFPKYTFRNVMRHYHANYPWYQFGIDLALGSGIDYEIPRREFAFAPVEMDGMLQAATIQGKPLVKDTNVLLNIPPQAAVQGPTPWYLTPLAASWAFLILVIALSWIGLVKHRRFRGFDAVFFTVLGLTGCLLTFLIFVSVHEATSPNWLYIWLNPLWLAVPVILWIPKAKKAVRIYFTIASAVMLLFMLCWPMIPQSANPAFFPLMAATLLRCLSEANPKF